MTPYDELKAAILEGREIWSRYFSECQEFACDFIRRFNLYLGGPARPVVGAARVQPKDGETTSDDGVVLFRADGHCEINLVLQMELPVRPIIERLHFSVIFKKTGDHFLVQALLPCSETPRQVRPGSGTDLDAVFSGIIESLKKGEREGVNRHISQGAKRIKGFRVEQA